jgi:AAHS family 4-hydroxybenzoate transporter-like MFS transporter
LTAYNLGGVSGALICAVVITLRITLADRDLLRRCRLDGVPSAGVNVAATGLFITGIGLHGLFVNAVQCSLYALCASST